MIPTLEDIIRMLVAGECTPDQARLWLAEHQKLQTEVDALGDVSPSLSRVMIDLILERRRQDERWGLQDHPSFDPALSSWDGGAPAGVVAARYGLPTEAKAKLDSQVAFNTGEGSWCHIVVEELAEAVGVYDKPEELRGELVQLLAVVAAWLECLDRRRDSHEKAALGRAPAELVVGNHEENAS